ncbi:BgTH12-03485 [Blumeria graminis f. sp. triticale]|uniref:BgTH12-03485 n=1 Tax=Blumeria graminis f. sp. triticale TaxID=1689686 RepID=A0A9W4CV76_BLUGR|nr:BgTH12-03485 [Blumeria graminis f. sp. triticale]
MVADQLGRMQMGATQYFVDYLQEYELKISQCGKTGWTDEYKIMHLEIAINALLCQLLMNKNLPEDNYAKWISKVQSISGRLENSPSYWPCNVRVGSIIAFKLYCRLC